MIVWGLAVIMIGMGLTLSVDDFRRVARMPKQVMIGVVAQYLIMPFLGWGIAKGLALWNQPSPSASSWSPAAPAARPPTW